ncbi:undecaprenyl/decaprenyl-phosphate alpha-N-acetylglucosaminyl 1-phosphate transferase [candidate division KSB1 bacterium]|nr:undecaprenyl/decaprenyl-phosphate alpha-N-acetylglucosaminyl 1-phosphate transferase [candidate division KSB1 bacterium]NIR69186.1 undecaprenyl/decaprenyl-phosphate alpha-N-acetylglucosaminyl 1-phosphate transferase [candidate division KSB1 bacterium]NIS25697.1 undecaprenyl/decaprenyl-phosphate alpha-N-acetylglucosaminyl 1-phosphate transferase [candidate division KSB1 bacterium]NIT72565.1 undecaprenyl/decaprenyl-phosphate alpha-N-acetylglucosaminyl 1-phosphate transferase [candidate division
MILDYLKLLLVSFFVTVMTMPLMIKLAFKVRLLDVPTGDPLKIHAKPTPLLGGLGITLAIITTLFVGAGALNVSLQTVFGIITASIGLWLIGVYDDYTGLHPLTRLLGQMIVASVVVVVNSWVIPLFPFAIFNVVVTVVCLVTLVNALNLLDGMDGLATGTTLMATVGFMVGFGFVENRLGILLSLTLIGACSGFLLYNLPPAKIFLGDNGSTVLGFLLGLCALLFCLSIESKSGLVVPVLILIVPLADITATVIRRLKKRTSILRGDRGHLYDQLLGLGLSERQTMALMCGFGTVGALLAMFIIAR